MGMMIRYPECNCEDFPCCGHYDEGESEPNYCDRCGSYHSISFDCDRWDDDDENTDDEDVLALRQPRGGDYDAD